LVWSDNVVALRREWFELSFPTVPKFRETVKKDDGWGLRRTRTDVVESEAVGKRDVVVVVGSGEDEEE